MLTALYIFQTASFGAPWRAELWNCGSRLYQSQNAPSAAWAVSCAENFAAHNGYAIAIRINGRFRGKRFNYARFRHHVS